jgi:hypothetical protein
MASFTFEPQKIYSTETGEVLPLGESEAASAILSGKAGFPKGTEVPMVNPRGDKVGVPAEQVGDALSGGFKIEPLAEQRARAEKQYYQSTGEQIKAGAEGTARGVTVGLSDFVGTATGLMDKEDAAKRKKYNPEVAIGSEVVGAVAPALFTGGSSVVAKAASMAPSAFISRASTRAAEELTKHIVKRGSSSVAKDIVGKTISATLGSAVEGAIYGAGAKVTEDALGDPNKAAESVLANVGLGAALGGASTLGLSALGHAIGFGASKATDLASKLTKTEIDDNTIVGTLIGAATGTSPRVNSAYLKNGGLSPDDLSKIGVNSNEFLERIGSIGDKASEGVDDLRAATRDAKFEMQQAHSDLVTSLKNAGDSAKDAKEKAAATLKEAVDDRIERLKERTAEPIVGEFVTKLEDMQQKLFEGSQNAGLKLAESDLSVPFKRLLDLRDGIIKELPSNVDKPKAVKLIEDQLEIISKDFSADSSTILRGPALQVIKQDVDRWLQPKGAFGYASDAKLAEYGDAGIQALKDFRNGIADILSKDKNYEEAMKPVREYAKLLSDLQKKAGIKDLSSANSFIKKFTDDVHAKQYQEILERTDKALGTNFKEQITSFASDKVIAANKRLRDEYLKKEFPNLYKISDEAEAAYELAKEKLDKNEIKAQIKHLSEYKNWQQTQAHLESAIDLAKKTQGLSTTSAKAFVDKALSGTNKKQSAQLDGILKMLGVEDVQRAKDSIRFMRQLNIENVAQGSKHVNLYGMLLGMAAGSVFGDEDNTALAAVLGAGGGAGIGAIVDKTGTKLAKKMLDSYIKLRNIEKMRQETSKVIYNSVRSFVREKDPIKKAATAGSVYYMMQNRFDSAQRDKSKKDKYTKFENRMNELGRITGDDAVAIDTIHSNIKPIAEVAPKTTEALASKALIAAKFLQSKAPQNPYSSFALFQGSKKWHPSDAELAKFERYTQAVDHPMSVLKDLNNGVMSPEGAETLKVVYPALYGEIVETVTEQITEHGKDIPYNKKSQLSLLLGTPLDPTMTPEFIAAMQNTPIVNAQALRQNLNKPTKPINMSSMETETQRLERGDV